jgi:hypothetical protein
MRLIAHRGNVSGKNTETENEPNHILNLLDRGVECEIDIHFTEDWKMWLGHDEPQYKFNINDFYKYNHLLWVHVKSFESNSQFVLLDEFNYFIQEQEPYSITSFKQLWTNVGIKCVPTLSVAVMPEIKEPENLHEAIAICTDDFRLWDKYAS